MDETSTDDDSSGNTMQKSHSTLLSVEQEGELSDIHNKAPVPQHSW